MSSTVTINIPGLRTVTQPNIIQHWRVAQNRKKKEQEIVEISMNVMSSLHPTMFGFISRPTVRFVRLGPNRRPVDGDNLKWSFKYIRDAVAKWFERDDNDKNWDWQYDQERTEEYGVRIEIEVPDGN